MITGRRDNPGDGPLHTAESDVPKCAYCGHVRGLHGLRNDRCISAFADGVKGRPCRCPGYVTPPGVSASERGAGELVHLLLGSAYVALLLLGVYAGTDGVRWCLLGAAAVLAAAHVGAGVVAAGRDGGGRS